MGVFSKRAFCFQFRSEQLHRGYLPQNKAILRHLARIQHSADLHRAKHHELAFNWTVVLQRRVPDLLERRRCDQNDIGGQIRVVDAVDQDKSARWIRHLYLHPTAGQIQELTKSPPAQLGIRVSMFDKEIRDLN